MPFSRERRGSQCPSWGDCLAGWTVWWALCGCYAVVFVLVGVVLVGGGSGTGGRRKVSIRVGVSVGVCGVPYLGLGGRSLRAGTREVSCVSAKGEGGGLWCGVM